MTRADRLKLAKAARELASLYARGRGPKLWPYSYCGCILGQVFKRAGIPNEDGSAAARLEIELGDATLTKATLHEVGTDYSGRIPGAVVFPLLWLADELESAP